MTDFERVNHAPAGSVFTLDFYLSWMSRSFLRSFLPESVAKGVFEGAKRGKVRTSLFSAPVPSPFSSDQPSEQFCKSGLGSRENREDHLCVRNDSVEDIFSTPR